MADDPDRDLLPTKEGSCIETCHSSLVCPGDLRERHAVCKLDRYDLEDRHLRLLDEMQQLKKYSNIQEDKIKRLATKLMRVSATPRTCATAAITIDNDKNRIQNLELENSKLKDKITVLKNQILNHRVLGRSSSQTRGLRTSASSGPTTCRSDVGRMKNATSTNSIHEREENLDIQKHISRIQELEKDRKIIIDQKTELEHELSLNRAGSQKEKVAENVEYIRLWRQLKQQQEKINETNSLNESLIAQINELKKLLDDTSKSNVGITAELMIEKKRLSELDEEIIRSKESQLSLREREEQIRDLSSEMKILQQHNSELISLSAKYSQVENENIELKKKISEQQTENYNLKSAFNNEKANMTALQAANGQLMGKLQELQSNMDALTIQLKSFQNQQQKSDIKNRENQFEIKKSDKQTNTTPIKTQRSSEIAKETELHSPERSNGIDHHNAANLAQYNENNQTPGRSPERTKIKGPSENHEYGAGNLSRDKMLKLLEEAQINTPLDSRNAAQMRQIEGLSPNNYGKSGHRQSLESEQESGYSSPRKPDIHEIVRYLCNVFKNYDNIQKREKNGIYNSTCCDPSCAINPESKNCPCIDRPSKGIADNIEILLKQALDDIRKSCELPDVSKPKIKSQKINKKNFCPNSKIFPQNEYSPILLSDDQGIIEVHIISLQLSSSAMNNLFSSDKKNHPSLIVSCDFCSQGNIFTQSEKFPNFDFNSSCIYRIPHLSIFLDRVLRHTISFQVYAVHPGGIPCAIANSKICIKDIIDFPENKLHYIIAMECIVPCYRELKFGQLSFWIRLSCDTDRINKFKLKASEKIESVENFADKIFQTKQSSPKLISQTSFEPEFTSTVSQSKSRKRKSFNSREKFLDNEAIKRVSIARRSDSSDFQEKKNQTDIQLTDDDEQKKIWKLWSTGKYSVQGFSRRQTGESKAISDFSSAGPSISSHLRDMNQVFSENNYRQSRRKSSIHRGNDIRNSVIIKIQRLRLSPKCQIFHDPDISRLYIEFSFLGYHGLDLETESIPKPSSAEVDLYFNYEKRFEIDEEEHSHQRNLLRAMLSGDANPNIKFTVVSEPTAEETETKECLDIGYAYLNLREHIVRKRKNDISLVVLNTDETNPIGTLEVMLLDSDTIRQCLYN